MGTLDGGERRRAERKERDDLTLRLTSGGRPVQEVQLRDVSPRGFGVQVATELKAGDKIKFELECPGDSLRGGAKVVWAEAFHMGYRGGLEITDLGWFERRKLNRVLTGKAGFLETGLDALLILGAAILGAMVIVDLALHPEVVKAFLLKISGQR